MSYLGENYSIRSAEEISAAFADIRKRSPIPKKSRMTAIWKFLWEK